MAIDESEKTVRLFINADTGLLMDVPPGETVYMQVSVAYFSRHPDTGALEEVIYLRKAVGRPSWRG